MHWCSLKTKSCRWFSAIKNIYWHALGWPEHKIVLPIFSYQEHLLTCIDGTLTRNLFGDFQRSRIPVDMHWCDMNKKLCRWFSAIKNTYLHALVGPEHKIFLAIFSYRGNLLTCIGGTLIQSLFWRFSAIKNTYWHALVRPEDKIFSVVFSYQENILTCIGGT